MRKLLLVILGLLLLFIVAICYAGFETEKIGIESSGNSTIYTYIQGGNQTGNATYTLPVALGNAGDILTDAAGNGILSWATAGGGSGDVTSVGDGLTGAVLDGSATGGTWLKFYDAQGAGQLITGNLTAARVWTLPDETGTLLITETDPTVDTSAKIQAIIGASVYEPAGIAVADITDATANGRSLISSTNYSTMRGLLDLEAGTDFNAYDADLATLASPTAWRLFYSNGTNVITELALGTDGQVLTSTGASTAPAFEAAAGGAGKYTVETKTADYSVLTTDVAKTLVMNAAGTTTFSLPSVASGDVGTWYTFAKIAAGKLIIDAADSDKIADSGAGDTIYNDQTLEVYATITLQLVSETQWAICGASGVWITTD